MTDNEIIESMKCCMRATSCYDATYAALKQNTERSTMYELRNDS